MENVLNYIVRLSQANLLLGLALVVGIFIVLICIAAVDRKVGYVKKEVELLLQHDGIEIPQPEPRKKKKGKTSEPAEDNTEK